MKVVLFCGGLGTRLREYSETVPKPLVPIGERPILWHLMRYYAHYGHTEFILCLGYKGMMIKEYFMEYREWASNDFRVSTATNDVELFNRDVDDWNITFVDTGMASNVGQRLMAVRHLVEDEPAFLANYADGLSDLDLPTQMDHFRRSAAVASFARVRPSQTFHTVSCREDGVVDRIAHVRDTDVWINGGYFILDQSIFDYIGSDEELVQKPFYRLVDEQRLVAYTHDGFFASMDTYQDKRNFDELNDNDDRPWEVWRPVRRR